MDVVAEHGFDPAPIAQRTLCMGDSVLRGSQALPVERPRRRGLAADDLAIR